jgi:putative DNA primase/helicase
MMSISASALAQQCDGAHQDKAGWRAKCPIHQGHSDTSLHLWEEAGNLRVHCFAGCKAQDILAALGHQPQARHVEHYDAIYSYRNLDGTVLYQVVRLPGKQFRQRRPDPVHVGRWVWDTKGTPLVLYQLPEVKQAVTLHQPIYLVEGEKDVETLRALGLVATCNRGGAGKWEDSYTAALGDADVIVLPDNDQPGRDHAALVAARLRGTVRSLAIVTLPDLPERGDVTDWLHKGHTLKDLQALTRQTAPTITRPRLVLRRFSEVEPEEVSWLWHPYIPLKKLTILEGDPGQGKTYLMLALAAAVTQGHSFPDQKGRVPPPHMDWGTVLYMSAEDDMADTLVPRAIAAGANRERLIEVSGWSNGGTVEPFSFAQLALLSEAIGDTKARLVIVDPIQGFIGEKVDTHRTNEVRPIMSQLRNIAEHHRCAILLIRHLTKGIGKALYRGQGSVDFTAAARSVLVVAESLEDESKKVMAQEKSSLAPKGASLVFQIRDDGFHWCGISRVNADELVHQQPIKAQHQLRAAAEWLEGALTDGEQQRESLRVEADANGMAWRTVERAKSVLKIITFKRDEKWFWKLPEPWDEERYPGSEEVTE